MLRCAGAAWPPLPLATADSSYSVTFAGYNAPPLAQGPTELKRPWKWENSEFKKMDSTIHTNLKHKLGNLALVGRRWNSKWGDCLYSDKRSDYAICGCRLLAEVALEHENWTPSTLLLRHNKLIQLLAAR